MRMFPLHGGFGTAALVVWLAVITALLPGCSLFVGSKQPITITATDPKAAIFVDGRPVGNGMATVSLKRDRPHAIMAKAGDRAGSSHIGTQISRTGVLDIVGGFFLIVPFLGVLAPGFWSLDSDQVTVVLPPPPAPAQRRGETN